MSQIVPESQKAKDSLIYLDPCRKMALALDLRIGKYGPDLEFGWSHSGFAHDGLLYVSELDCLWAGLQAVADWLAREGFEGKADLSREGA